MAKKVLCPSCKGKGHVFEAITLLCPIFWIIAPFERNNINGVTRRDCGQCDGEGYIKW